MYMQEALDAVCRKRKLDHNEYALLVRDMSVLILLDRTVASLEGKSDLVLVKRSMLPRYGIVDTGKAMRTTDPNGGSFSFSRIVQGLTWLYSCSFDIQEDVRNPWSAKLGDGLHWRLQGAVKRTGVRSRVTNPVRRNTLSPGSYPCSWEGTRGFWQ